MVLITYITLENYTNYKGELIQCLVNNVNISIISEIFVFCEKTFINLPSKNKIKYFVKNEYSEIDIINYVKKITNRDTIIWSSPFVKFDTSLIKYKNVEIFKSKDYTIFSKQNQLNDYIINSYKFYTNKENKENRLKLKSTNIMSKINNFFTNSKKIDVILVSINYNKFLDKTLYHNSKIFDNITVVTHIEDIECIEICKKYGVKCLVNKEIVKDKKINKSIGINLAIDSIKDPDWILILDADIIVTDKINIQNLDRESLYTSGRYICSDMNNYEKWKNGELNKSDIGKYENDKGIGFFQLFNYSKKQKYPESEYGRYSDSTWSDVIFKRGFKNRHTIDYLSGVIHLGKAYKAWKEVSFKTKTKLVTNKPKTDILELTNQIIKRKGKVNIQNGSIDKLQNKMSILKVLNRDTNIKPKLAVVTSFFNPNNYINIKYNYLKFSEKIREKADLFPIELSYNGDFFIQDKNVIRIKGDSNNILWQKEKLLNIAIKKLPKEYTNVAWIDCDILFENENWVDEVNEKLKSYKILQLYEKAKRLDGEGKVGTVSEGIISRLSNIDRIENSLIGIPGFAWAGRRECIDKIGGLLETQIIGGADALMYFSFLGRKDTIFHQRMNNEWMSVFLSWFRSAYNEINRSVSYISGDIIHLYHGRMSNRNYGNRYKILSDSRFNPLVDLKTDNNGLWEFKNRKILDKMSKYFEDRKEDDNVLNINDYFDNIYVLNLDRSTDRYLKIKNKLESLNIKYQRFSAVDGKNINDNEYDFSKFVQGRGMIENKYALGCLRSHISIIKDAKDKGYKKILILEDDILVSKDIHVYFQKLRNIDNWKLLYFGSSQYNWDVQFIDDFYYAKRTLGTFSYALDHTIYDQILSSNKEELSFDNLIVKSLQEKFKGQCYVFYPNICIADVSESLIRENRNQELHSKKMRWDILKNYI